MTHRKMEILGRELVRQPTLNKKRLRNAWHSRASVSHFADPKK